MGKKKKAKEQQFTLHDTSVIQAESLRLFMSALGYFPLRANGGWYTDNPGLQANRVISTRTAIRLHNLQEQQWVAVTQGWFRPSDVNIDIALTRQSLHVAFASKLVKKVKLVPKRNAINGIVMPVDPLSHLIRPTDPQYFVDWGIINPVV